MLFGLLLLPNAVNAYVVMPFYNAAPASCLSRRSGPVRCDETKGALSGAVLGGLVAGPFGALWGAQIGGNMGANNRAKKEAQQRLDRMGLSKEVLDAARACASDIEEAEESLKLVRRAEASQRGLLTTFERQAAVAYEAAEAALRSGDEAQARTHLEERARLKPKITAANSELQSATNRVAVLEADCDTLREQAAKIEAMVGRSVSASAEARSSSLALEPEDPLLAKFKELEDR